MATFFYINEASSVVEEEKMIIGPERREEEDGSSFRELKYDGGLLFFIARGEKGKACRSKFGGPQAQLDPGPLSDCIRDLKDKMEKVAGVQLRKTMSETRAGARLYLRTTDSVQVEGAANDFKKLVELGGAKGTMDVMLQILGEFHFFLYLLLTYQL